MTSRLRSAFTAFAATLLFALPAAADRLELVSGNNQTAAPGTLLEAFVVRVVTDAGVPKEGANVTFGNGAFTSCGTYAGGGSSAVVVSGAGGTSTSPRMTTSSNAGECNLVASLPSNGPGGPAPVAFKVTITGSGTGPPPTGAANRLEVVSGSGQSAGPGVALAPFVVRLTSPSGVPIGGTGISLSDAGFPSSCGTFPGGATSVVVNTAADGTATSPAFTTSATPRSCSVSARQVSADITQNVSTTISFTIIPGSTTSTNYQDMWWAGQAENGWGMAILQHETRLFAVIYAYDAAGRATWYVMPGGTFNTNQTAITGSLYRPTGTPFHAYNASALVVGEPVGTVTLTFSNSSNATMAYTVSGLSGTKTLTRQSFANGMTTPTATKSDMWWGGSAQNGWGISILQQGQSLFSAWFTYNDAGQATWFVMPGGSWTTQDTYEGRIYRTTGSAWAGAAYNPAALVVTDAGTYKLRFTGTTAFFDYSVDGRTGTMALSRQSF